MRVSEHGQEIAKSQVQRGASHPASFWTVLARECLRPALGLVRFKVLDGWRWPKGPISQYPSANRAAPGRLYSHPRFGRASPLAPNPSSCKRERPQPTMSYEIVLDARMHCI